MIYLGADHGGFELKDKIKEWLKKWEFEFVDCGAYEYNPEDDYPDFAVKVARNVAKSPVKNKGIIICRSGIGVSVTANKVAKIRCGLCTSKKQVKAARAHNNINVLALPADYLVQKDVLEIVKLFLETEFSYGERHERRLKKIEKLETGN